MVATQLALLFGCAFILFRHSSTKVALGLRITSIEVPSAVMNSSQVTLACNYELQGDQLYSVKWYKNYVEFYRFQPNQMAAAQDSQQQQPPNSGSKHEFELEGINLNLSKSNATHVHLKQTSLSSEGTYKCEISADSPSFATISSERQMKVYVLPRQKLSVVDNTKQHQHDLINLTCTSGPSRPVAELRWLINDSPIPSSSKWLLHHNSQQQQQHQPVDEARLTLAFRFQPNLLAQLASSGANRGGENPKLVANRQQLEFKCVAKIGLKFVAETSIAVAGGKTTQLKRRNREPTTAQSVASPLVGQTADNPDHSRPIDGAHLQTGVAVRLRAGAASRPLLEANQTTLAAPVRHQQQQQQQPQAPVFLTSKQLRSRAEQIEQILRLTRPNDLQPPLIEARSQLFDHAELEPDQVGADEEKPPPGASEESGEEDQESSRSQPAARPAPDSDTVDEPADRDYQLNELVLFTCSAQLPFRWDPNSSVHFSWLINNKEVDSNHINHFDGNRFVLQRTEQKLARKKQNPSQPDQSSLLVEFAPSLFQLKELDLKCRTSIEQPLIDYETTLLADVPSNQPPGYIEADQTGGESLHSNPRGQHNRPWVLKQPSQQQQQQQQQRRNQVLRLQKQQQSSSSSSSLSFSSCLLQPAIVAVNLLVAVACFGQTGR